MPTRSLAFISKLGAICAGGYLCIFAIALTLDALGPQDALPRVFVMLCSLPWFAMMAAVALAYNITVPPIVGTTLFGLCIFLNTSIFYGLGAMLSKLVESIYGLPETPQR